MYTPVDQLSGGPQRQTAAAPMYGSGGMTPLPWMGNNRGLFPGSSGGGWQTPSWGGQPGSAQPRGVAFRPNPQPLPWTAQPQPAPMAPGGQGSMGPGWNPYGNESSYWGGQAGSAQPRGVAFRPNPQPLPWTAQPQPAPMAPGGQGSMGPGWNPYGNESSYWGGQPSPYPTPYSSGAMTGGSISGPTNPSMPGVGVGGGPTGAAGIIGGPQNTNGGFMPGGMPQGPSTNIWQTPTQQGAPSNVVQGSAGLNMNQKAWGMGNMMNYGQLDPTGTKQWVGGGGGEQGQWQNYNPNDPNQSAVNSMFNRYGSNWNSGAAGAYGHSSEMPAQFQALYGRQGTQQELNDLYYNVNGDAARAHDAFANQSASYNPSSSSYNPQAVQNLTSLNLLAHQ